MNVMYSGSFDPITNGHLDIIRRCSEKFGGVTVVVFENMSKNHLFTSEERKEIIENVIKEIDGVNVDISNTMLVEYAKINKFDLVIRGLRAVSDYEYEMKIAFINNLLYNGIETLFMLYAPEHSFISSSIVKEIASYKGDISKMVPELVAEALYEKLETKKGVSQGNNFQGLLNFA